MQQDIYPSLKPTVLIDSVARLQLERATGSLARSRPRGASVAITLGVAAVAGAGIGLWPSNTASDRAEPGGSATAAVSCACEDPARSDPARSESC